MEAKMDVKVEKRSGTFVARIVSLSTLVALVAGVGYVGREGYRALTDSFVAPTILSPDNDLVLQNKVRISELYVEKARAVAELEAIDADLVACDATITRLNGLRETASRALTWTRKVTAGQAVANVSDTKAIDKQRDTLAAMIDKQTKITEAARANLEAGLVTKLEFAKEQQSLHQLELSMLDNERKRIQADQQQRQNDLAQASLATQGVSSIPMPEVVMREDQMVRIELELTRIQAELRKKTAEKKLLQDKLAKFDELEGQLKARPIFRAADQSMDVAFVPYTQLEGVREGQAVYDCVWGVFACKQVGRVSEMVPGEVILPDPWGTPSRGQFAVLDLTDRESAKSKTLRVRPSGPVVALKLSKSNQSVAVK